MKKFKHLFINKQFLSSKLSCINYMKRFSSYNSISPLSLDGNVSSDPIFSEYGLIKYRTIVEVEWLKSLVLHLIEDNDLGCDRYSVSNQLDAITNGFDINCAYKVKEIENVTNHDVKAVEYYIKEEMEKLKIPNQIKEFTHFCCTSEDINNLAWNLVINEYIHTTYSLKLNLTIYKLKSLTEKYASLTMMSLTHGQPATPTTFGKEIANFTYRINEIAYKLRQIKLKAKINGAVGNFNAHYLVVKDFNWLTHSKDFIEKLGLEYNPFTTQIENHDSLCELFSYCILINSVLIDMIRDVWGYSSLEYLKIVSDHIDIGQILQSVENELYISNSIFNHLKLKLPISRFQRDLSDSTVIRNIGIAFQYSLNSICRILDILDGIQINEKKINEDLDNHWELMAEPLQTVMRYRGLESPYEKLKELTRGKKFTKEEYFELIRSYELSESIKEELLKLTPFNYLGKAKYLAENLKDYLK